MRGLKPPLKGCGAQFLPLHDDRTVKRPGHDRAASMIKVLQVCNVGAFCFQLQHGIFLLGDKGDEFGAEMGEIVQGKAVGELAGADTEDALRLCRKFSLQFCKESLNIDEKTEPRIVKIRLQNAVHTVHGAVHADIEHLVVAAAVFPGAGAGFEKCAPVAAEQKMPFACA